MLQDQHVGAFEVETVLNQPCQDVEIALARFLSTGKRGDTLLLHFSCHGVKDLSGELYFATTDTDLSLLKVTGVASSMVKEAIDESRASLILCLVDCCYSGAFTKSTKAAATLDLTERLGGQGRAVITASTSLQLALDGKEEPSLFTRAVVEGLRTRRGGPRPGRAGLAGRVLQLRARAGDRGEPGPDAAQELRRPG